MALRNLLVRVGADISGLSRGLKDAQKQVSFFGRNVTGSLKEIQGKIAAIGSTIGGGLVLKQGIQDAMRYEALMATLGETLGKNVKDFEKWQSSVGSAMGFSRLQSAELASTMSLNFKSIATSTADLTKKTTDMMELAAIISNKRGMTMTEVSDRIRSAMNQEADGAMELGVDVRTAAIMQSEAYKMLGQGQPFDKLSESVRKTILYQHLFQQVSQNLGTTLQDTTAMRMAAFTASLADVRMALGQAFLPIIYSVLPLLTKMAQALFYVLQVIAAFMRSLFGGGFKFKPPVTNANVKTTNQQAQALGDVGKAADKAGKKSEKAGKKSAKAGKEAAKAWTGLFSFDEVHTIDDPEKGADKGATDAGAGVGGAGGGIGDGGGGGLGGMQMPAPDFSGFEGGIADLASKMDKYTKPIRDFFKKVWKEISSFAKEEFGKIADWWGENGATIMKGMKLVGSVVWAVIKTVGKFIWDSLKMAIDGVIKVFMGLISFFTGVFTGDWKTAWDGLKDIFFGAIEALMGFWNLSFIGGLRKLLVEFAVDGVKILGKWTGDLRSLFSKNVADLWAYWKGLLANIKNIAAEMKAFIDGKVELMKTSFKTFWDRVSAGAKTAVNALKSVWSGVKEWFYRTVISPIASNLESIKDSFSRGIGSGFKAVVNSAISGFNNALGAFNRLKNATPIGGMIPDLHIPYLAKGGIATGATLAMVGEGRSDEAIAPLDRLQSFITNAVVAAMQVHGGGNAVGGDIVLNIDGRRLARIVKPFIDAENKRVGANVKLNPI